MNTAAIPILRPMRVAELLDATIRLYRKSFLTFVAIVAVVQIPLLVINGLLTIPTSQAGQEMVGSLPSDPTSFDPEDFAAGEPFPLIPSSMGRFYLWWGLQMVVSGVLGVVGTSLMTGAMAWAVSERHLDRPITVGGAYRAVFRRWKPLLGAMLLTLGVYLFLVIVGLVPCIGWVIVLPAGVFTYVCLRFAPQAVMLEEQRAADSLTRSWYLTKPHFWRVLGIIALLWLLGMLITLGPSYLVQFGVVAIQASYLVRTLAATAASALLSLLYTPIRLAGETLIYYDLRVRQEGLDLEMEMDALALAEEVGEQLLPEPAESGWPSVPVAPADREPFLTGRDWRNLAILFGVALGIVVVCCVLYVALMAVIMTALAPMMEQMMEYLPTFTPSP